MTDVVCPICKAPAKALGKISDADGFDCREHGGFRVADTAFAIHANRSRGEWEVALERAKQKTPLGVTPTITTYCF